MADVSFLPDHEMDDFTNVSFKVTVANTREVTGGGTTQTTEQKKAQLPIIPVGATKHQLLCCLQKFDRAKSTMQWTNGPKLFESIQETLENPANVKHWDSLCLRNPDS